MAYHILQINQCHSDGSPQKWPAAERNMIPNDDYFLQRVGQLWAADIDAPQFNRINYRLSALPDGYAGFEKARADSKHVDRYVYGHPNGVFRSLAEFYPHFKHLMDQGNPTGCECKLCSPKAERSRNRPSQSNENASAGSKSDALSQSSKYFSKPPKPTQTTHKAHKLFNLTTANPGAPQSAEALAAARLPQGRNRSPANRGRHKQVDEEGSVDVYRGLLNQLNALEEDATIDQRIVESTSPDWRATDSMLTDLLSSWKKLPRYIPRTGELVLFVRKLSADVTLALDPELSSQTWTSFSSSGVRLDRPRWEAGVVTQMPTELLSDEDLISEADRKSGNVVYSGFRVEPLSATGSAGKLYRQHTYVPLHAIRPFVYWRESVYGLQEQDWHPTIRHALTITNSFTVISKHRFIGNKDPHDGPQATVFCRGVYIGAEMITVGDMVRLLPNPLEQKQESVTDVMLVTSIKLRFVQLDKAGDDDWDNGRPYNICLHISGKAYTLDPSRSFGGIGRSPVNWETQDLRQQLSGYGKWFHLTDPASPKARLEVPFTRILGRCFESTALNAWFRRPGSNSTAISVNRGIAGMFEARNYSLQHDKRIDGAAGKTWFWADTRVEQLDLHEVNGRHVGTRDNTRMKPQMSRWCGALKALEGKQGAVAEFRQMKTSGTTGSSVGYGMIGTSASQAQDPDEDVDDEDDDDGNEYEALSVDESSGDAMETDGQQLASEDGIIELSD